jgi:type I restriction enzyme S subunit
MWSATFGPHIWKGDKAIFHYHIWKVECSKKMLQQYYYYDLLRFTETVLEGANGSTMAHITKEGMDKRLTITPTIDEQKLITNKLLSVDKQLQTEQSYLLKLQRIKAGLMSDLLSGRKSVTAKKEEIS